MEKETSVVRVSDARKAQSVNEKCGVTYFVTFDDVYVKIGFTKQIKERFSALQIAQPQPLKVLGMVDGDIEFETHRRFATERVHGEWFKLSAVVREFIGTQTNVPSETERKEISPGKYTAKRQRGVMFPCTVWGSVSTLRNARIAHDNTCRPYRKCTNGNATKTIESSFEFNADHEEEIRYVFEKVRKTILDLYTNGTNAKAT